MLQSQDHTQTHCYSMGYRAEFACQHDMECTTLKPVQDEADHLIAHVMSCRKHGPLAGDSGRYKLLLRDQVCGPDDDAPVQ